jgi:hypothetical protein
MGGGRCEDPAQDGSALRRVETLNPRTLRSNPKNNGGLLTAGGKKADLLRPKWTFKVDMEFASQESGWRL